MSHSIFGWDYPPGCSSVPGDEPEICATCGAVDYKNCNCPECPKCSIPGCVEHKTTQEVVLLWERQRKVTYNLELELQRRFEKEPCLCKFCKKPITWKEFLVSFEDGCSHAACEDKAAIIKES